MKSLISVAAVVLCVFQIVFVDADLIDDTCRNTPEPAICSSSLKPFYKTHEPKSVRELATLLASTALVDKIYATDNVIKGLQKGSPGDKSLLNCSNIFADIKNRRIEQFRRSLINRDYDSTMKELNNIVDVTEVCRRGIELSRSVLAGKCTQVTDLAQDAVSVILQIP
ncbi:hypothetical protein M0R45_020153 [Rubus argutus]|uniref:Pectinesterase inhibitor domain-containing protein n=1 Tax=Rubus argutus TaxID=59490 RepID=A0AAW1X9C5_RUBAR